MFIDVHCHLDLCKDWEKIVERAKKADVIMITQGTRLGSNKKAVEFSEKYKNVKAALGLYPVEASEMDNNKFEKEIEFIKKNSDKIVAIGEVGLDLKELNSLEKQHERFKRFIELAIELNKPIIVHSRKAEKEAIEILEKEKARKVIMHCFNGNMKLVERIVKNGWYLSIPTNVVHSEHFQNVIKIVDIEKLLCETDSPFLHPFKERNNEPANVIESYKKIAEIKGISLKEAEKKIEENYKRLFC